MRARVCLACSWRSVESYRRRCPLTFVIVSSYHGFSHPSIPRMNCTKERGAMSSTTNEAVYRRLIEEGFNQGNLAVVEEVISVGDKLWVRQRGGGTNLGPFNGHPPTGRNAFTDVMDVVRFQDGMVVEHWGVPDQLGMMQALGLIPSR